LGKYLIAMTINSLNNKSIEDLILEWKSIVNNVGFQFHTPFADNDPLWLPYGELRNKVVDTLIGKQKKYSEFVMNTQKQLEIIKNSWGGINTTLSECPSRAILSGS
jgi:Fe-coproporphyrin III synthase